MRFLVILGLLLAVPLVASPVMSASDNPLTIKTMKMSVWPEYDDPRILVTYQGEFKDGSTFPQGVKFPLQPGAEVNQVCALTPNNEHLCQLYETLATQEDLAVSYTLPIPTYYLEYYWDGIKGQTDKSFTFKYVSPYAVDSLEIELQQPLKATNFKLTQPYASATSDGLGMKYYRYVFNNVTPGQVINLDASYTKSDNKPSVAKKSNSGTTSSSDGSNAYLIMGIGATMLAVVFIGFMALRRKPAAASVRTASRQISRKAARAEFRRAEAQRAHRQEMPKPSRSPAAQTTPAGTGAAFCSKCGAKLPAGAYFCHVCGAKIRGAA